MPGLMGIDIETYSSAPLPRCGVYRYCDAPDFEILLFSYAFDDEPVQTIDLARGETLPKEVISALEDPDIIKVAYNAQFERVCLSRYLGHWLDPHQWRCTMVMAAYLTLPGRLADAAVALGTTEKKMEEGKDLIRYFSVPCKPSKTNGGRTRNLPTDAPEKWAVYRQYNAQDVETERAIRKALEKYSLPEQEWELYALDQQINDRGVRVDKKLVKNAIAVDAVFAQAAYQRAKELTGLENPGSVNQLKAWLADQDMQPLVDAWRAANPNIVAFWSALDRAARTVIRKKTSARVGKVTLYWQDDKMFMRLPSGRNLCYQSPHFTENRFGSDAIGYYAPNAAGQMVVQETFGGKLAENATQAIARDILAHALLTLEKNGYPVIFHVHDEAVIEMPNGQGSLEEACRLMAIAPDWAENLPLRADGEDHLAFYRKT